MNTAVYAEPYKLPAGALALAVHAMFFALLYFGVNWRAEPPQGMVVDIWDSLPEMKSTPAKVAPPEVAQVEPPKPPEPSQLVEPVPPVEPPKADIALPEKKKPKAKPVEIKKPVEHKKPLVKQKPPTEQKSTEPKITEAGQAQQAAQAEQGRVQAEQDRVRAEQAGAIGRVVDEYKAKIHDKIQYNIPPLDVPDNLQAEFEVILLPGGPVLSAKLTKPSGSAAYDAAVERAIIKSQPLPLPPDVALFNKFRELHLTFRPKKKKEI